jgi:EAL domain-containing protein (putative c-di-GMP-specific phosphodiesterase class I)
MLNLHMPDTESINYLKELAKQKPPAKVIACGTACRALATTWQLGSILGLEMAAKLPKLPSMHALRAELCKLMVDSHQASSVQLSAAIKAGKIRPHYQPKVSRDAGGAWVFNEVEALARWHRPGRTLLPPNNFIGLAEDNGLIHALTDSMLNQVVTQLGLWNRQGYRLHAAVNLAPSHLGDRDFPRQLECLLKKHHVECEQLILEITENFIFDHDSVSVDVLHALRVKKVGLAIDNFSSGFSSLEQLCRMPFDELKIDRSFVKRLQASNHMSTIIEGMVLLGQKLGMMVCAEGVDSQDAFDFLDRVGCDKQQGFLIGQPVPAADIASHMPHYTDRAHRARAILQSTEAQCLVATK